MRNGVSLTLFLILGLIFIGQGDSLGAPPTPQVLEKMKQEGRLQEWKDLWESAAQRGMYDRKSSKLPRLTKGTASSVDTLKPLVICVEFTDNPHTYATSNFSTLLFSQGFVVPTGSLRDYYLENSYGKHDVQGGVYGWVTAPHEYSYYTGGDYGMGDAPNAQTLVSDLINQIDGSVNFANYDYNNDHVLDGLIIVHAGPGAEETDDYWDFWSHSWEITPMTRDGVTISDYTMQPEEHASGLLIDIGVFCHEWGHDLGIEWEEYDKEGSSGLGDWTVMAFGCYNNGGKTPAHHSAYCKYVLGWINVINVGSNLTDVEILQAETTPVAYKLWNPVLGSGQYFMVENRQKTKFDSSLPGEGLLIYHVDTNIGTNDLEWCPGGTPEYHFRVALEQADGRFGLEGCGVSYNYGDLTDPFPSYLNKRAFEDTTLPSSRDYYETSTQIAVWNISNSDSAMYANLDVTWSRPNLALESFSFDDNSGGDGDGRAEPEETVDLYFSLSNSWKSLSGAWVIASADTEGISFSIDSVFLGDILSGTTVNNTGKPLQFTIAAGFPSQIVEFNLHICGDGGSYCADRTHSTSVGPPEILLVDDDNCVSGDSNYAPIYQNALDRLGAVYETWDNAAKPTTLDLSPYPIVIWFTGNSRSGVLPEQDVQALMDYLDGGGNLFLTSQDAAEKLFTSGEQIDTDFLTNYLHTGSYGGNYGGFFGMGISQDPVFNEVYLRIGGDFAPDNQVSKDILVPDLNASSALRYAGIFFAPTDSIAGIKYEGDFRVLFFGFGLEGIDSSGMDMYGQTLSTPTTLMQKALQWLRGSSGVLEEEESVVRPTAFELHQNYPNPFNPLTTIRYTVNGSQLSIRSPLRTTLKIFNVRGQLVRTLVDEEKTRGTYSVVWDGRNQEGSEVSSGVYFYQLNVGDESEVKRMVLLK